MMLVPAASVADGLRVKVIVLETFVSLVLSLMVSVVHDTRPDLAPSTELDIVCSKIKALEEMEAMVGITAARADAGFFRMNLMTLSALLGMV